MSGICFRSGYCCKGHFCIVPKTEESDISPEKLESLSFDELESYLEMNTEPQGDECKWLTTDPITTEATCKVHAKKSSMCLEHPSEVDYCRVGYHYWLKRLDNSLPVPVHTIHLMNSCKPLPKKYLPST